MAVGNYTWFDKATKKPSDGTMDFGSDTIKAILCNASQVLDESFVGASGNCRLSDITGQLTTANGYTSGGQALTNVTFTESVGEVVLAADPLTWVPSGAGITFKYLVFFDDTAANDDLIGFLDIDNSSTSATATANVGNDLIFNNSQGFFGWSNVNA